MEAINHKLDSVTLKLGHLVNLVSRLREENARIEDENSRLKAEIGELRNNVAEIEKKNINLQLTNSINPDKEEPDNALLKQKLDSFIQEIDECIARLKG